MNQVEPPSWFKRGIQLTLGALLVVGLAAIALRGMEFLIIVFLAIVLGAGVEPITRGISARRHWGRGRAILAVYGLFATILTVLAVLMVPAVLSPLNELSGTFPAALDRWRGWAAGLPSSVAAPVTSLIDSVQQGLHSPPALAAGDLINTGLTVAGAVVILIAILTLAYFWVEGRDRIQAYVLRFAPAAERVGLREAWDEMENRLGLWVRGQLTVMGAIGIATFIAYTLLGLPAALLLALFAGLAEAIPVVGPAIGAVPALIIALTVSPETAVAVAVVYVLIQFVEGNILVPMVMKNTIGLSPFVVGVLLLFGGGVGGLVGAFVAIPIAAALQVVLDRLHAEPIAVASVGVSEVPGV